MVDFRKPGVIIALATIALFVLSMFAVLLSTPNAGQPGGTARPSPTAAGDSFSGSGRAIGIVTSLSKDLLVQCNSTKFTALQEQVLSKVVGVEGVIEVADRLAAASISSNFSSNESLARQVIFQVQVALSPYCTLAVLRKGSVEVNGSVTLVSDDGKKNATIYSRELDALGNLLGSGGQGVPAYLQPGAQVNDTARLVVLAQLSGGKVAQWFAQQAEETATRVVSKTAGASVEKLLPQLSVEAPIAWKERRVNASVVVAQANQSGNYSIDSFDYSPVNAIVFLDAFNQSSNASDAQIAALRKLAFVKQAGLQPDSSMLVLVAENYSDADGFARLALQNNFSGRISFPNSTLYAAVSFQNASLYPAAISQLRFEFGPAASIWREAEISPVDRAALSAELGLALPGVLPGQVEAGVQEHDLVSAEYRFLARGTSVLQGQARQVLGSEVIGAMQRGVKPAH